MNFLKKLKIFFGTFKKISNFFWTFEKSRKQVFFELLKKFKTFFELIKKTREFFWTFKKVSKTKLEIHFLKNPNKFTSPCILIFWPKYFFSHSLLCRSISENNAWINATRHAPISKRYMKASCQFSSLQFLLLFQWFLHFLRYEFRSRGSMKENKEEKTMCKR